MVFKRRNTIISGQWTARERRTRGQPDSEGGCGSTIGDKEGKITRERRMNTCLEGYILIERMGLYKGDERRKEVSEILEM